MKKGQTTEAAEESSKPHLSYHNKNTEGQPVLKFN